ncbi:MAG: phosphatase PAP2 family protein [Verrucomicrobiales bacterium]|nr:phosphatase PAP2 family protein [Verrucomicrobiales bacterium]MBP9222935.1 phosphatase PAP2 family protein [Verrucomicrobiales bacterium]
MLSDPLSETGVSRASCVRQWGRDLVRSLEKAPTGKRFPVVTLLLLPALFVAGLTVWARVSGFDLGAEKLIYFVGGNSWKLGDHPFWSILYHWGTLPAAVTVFTAFGFYLLSWTTNPLRKWRKVFLFVLLSAVIGPGFITNGLLKPSSGRPRPREILELGGRSAFLPVFVQESTSAGHSFPSGHATMGFFFLTGFFVFRRHRRVIAEGFLFGGIVAGGLIGIARMTQGGHFFTDVVWAGVICYLTPLILYYLLGLDRSLIVSKGGRFSKLPNWGKVMAGTGAVTVLIAVLAATPYDETRIYSISNELDANAPLTVQLRLVGGNGKILPGDAFLLKSNSYGHGLPTSRISRNYLDTESSGGLSAIYTERLSGWFAEVQTNLNLEIPWARLRHLKVESGEAALTIRLAPSAEEATIELVSGSGVVTIQTGGEGLRWIGKDDDSRLAGDYDQKSVTPQTTEFQLQAGDAFTGTIRIDREISSIKSQR